jgi:transketolase
VEAPDMRGAFVAALVEQAAADPRVFLLSGDLGWSVLDPFISAFSDRFVNVGVAEQNMVGVASGLAMTGYVPFCYTIATFAAMRPYEQFRDGPVRHRLPVRLVGVGGGYAYGHAGATHFALEDLCLMRCQPGLTVIAPADPAQTRTVMQVVRDVPGPVYLRVGKGGNPEIPGLEGRFALGRPEVVRAGSDVLLLATGAVAFNAVEAARRLHAAGLSASVAVMAHLPADPPVALAELLARHRAVVTVEEGYPSGGLGALVAECVAGFGLRCRLAIRGVRTPPTGVTGAAAYLQGLAGLGPDALADAARRLVES